MHVPRRRPDPPSRIVYEGHHIRFKRDIHSGLYRVKYWPIDGDEEEDSISRGGFVSKEFALNLVKDRIDDDNESLRQLEAQRNEHKPEG